MQQNDKKALGITDSRGVNQNERMFKALAPEYARIDERSTSDLLAFAVRYADIVRFHSLDPQKPVATWAPFFKNDISLFFATIIATDTRKIEQEHNALIKKLTDSPQADEKIEALEGLFGQVLNLALLMDDWYKQSLQMNRLNPNDTNELEIELENAIRQQLSVQLQQLRDFQRDLGFNRTGKFSDEEIESTFHAIWFPKQLLDERALSADDPLVEDKIKHYTKQIRLQYRSFYSVLSYLIQVAPKYLEQTLTEKHDHRPDMAMYMAFVELFKHNQAHLNTLTEKHLDFYYYDVLKQRERSYIPDKVNVYFGIADNIDTYVLPKGTLLEAGQDADGNDRYYATDYDMELNQAQISSLKTVYVSKNPKISSGIGSSYRIITNLYAAPIANSRNGLGEPFINGEEDWPTFGEEMLDKSEYERQMGFADIGWALSAPILEMEEGHRIMTFRMEFDKASMYTLNLLIRDIARKQELPEGVEPNKEDTFTRIFRNSITVLLTTTEGWTQASTCEVLPPEDWSKPELTIVATLHPVAPAVVNYDAQLHGNGFDTRFPVVKFMQKNIDVIFSYSFLKELLLERIFVETTVKGIKNLQLSSDVGPLDASTPFQPFGPMPRVGSYLVIGKSELFKKELTDLKINIEWHNLPDHKKGFAGYYKEYGMGVRNDSFKVRFSALSGGTFSPVYEGETEPELQHSLFREQEAKEGLNPKTVFDGIDLKVLNIKPDYTAELQPVFNNNARSGYLKVELIAPKMGFGHDDFAPLYTVAVTQNANPKRREEMPLPKQPFTPVVKKLTLDYSASTRIDIISVGTISKGEAAVEQLYHIHPFGIVRTFNEGRMLNRSLLPTYDDDAYLYIGLRAMTPPCSLSFYFELRENQDLFSFDKPTAKPEITWSYLVNDEWRDFSQVNILSDTTNGFNNSGIVSLDIPRDPTRHNRVLTPGLHWLRVSVKGDTSKLGRTRFVTTQALTATWVNRGNNLNHLEQPLPPYSVVRLSNPVSQVRLVSQPFPSFGGRPAEKKPDFYTRTSERLRHKGRAVSAWDFERLVLEQFPFLFQVKCITHMAYPDFVKPGSVVLVVVPRVKADGTFSLPRVSYTVLQSIKEFLEPMASPFLSIEVRNPVYERLKITCGVRFEKGKNNGTFLKQLNRDIMEFLCPWVVGQDRELDLGGLLPKDLVINFIEKRPYVEFATKFSIVQVFANERGFDVEDTAIDTSSSPLVHATKPWAVLIPFETNPIYLLDEVTYQAPDKSAIDSMYISGDFVLTEEKDTDFDFNKKK